MCILLSSGWGFVESLNISFPRINKRENTTRISIIGSQQEHACASILIRRKTDGLLKFNSRIHAPYHARASIIVLCNTDVKIRDLETFSSLIPNFSGRKTAPGVL